MRRLHAIAVVATAGMLVLAGCGGGDDGGGDDGGGAASADAGKDLFSATCASCHGPDAKGLPGSGKNLVTSQFVADQTDDELVDFITVGRAADDPENTTGVAMPAKGGNPSLTDDDLADIVAYLRTINEG